MNTAIARRLALGDPVIWTGKDDYQPSRPGTIIRFTAHQVEVLWQGETAIRYRCGQLHNLRHEKKLISAAAEFPCTSPYGLDSARYLRLPAQPCRRTRSAHRNGLGAKRVVDKTG
jgi:hypothetical protein